MLMREFFTPLTSKLITNFIDNFNSGMQSKPIAHFLSGSEHIYMILGLEVDVHSTQVLWTPRPSIMQGQLFLGVERGRKHISIEFKTIFSGVAQGIASHTLRSLSYHGTPSLKAWWECFSIRPYAIHKLRCHSCSLSQMGHLTPGLVYQHMVPLNSRCSRIL